LHPASILLYTLLLLLRTLLLGPLLPVLYLRCAAARGRCQLLPQDVGSTLPQHIHHRKPHTAAMRCAAAQRLLHGWPNLPGQLSGPCLTLLQVLPQQVAQQQRQHGCGALPGGLRQR
jgi:hypothetical protein